MSTVSSKPETTFTRFINNLLIPDIYHLKMANPYIGGPPDVYYEGNAGILFVEYKYVPTFPPTLDLTKNNQLTRLQADWLARAESNGVQCAVIVGCQSDGLILEGQEAWRRPVGRTEWLATKSTRREIADWITRKVYMCQRPSKSSESS